MPLILLLISCLFTGDSTKYNFPLNISVKDTFSVNLPFNTEEPPPLDIKVQGDSILLLNEYGADFFIMNRKGDVLNKIVFSKYTGTYFFPNEFYVSKHYFLLADQFSMLMLNKSLQFHGIYFLSYEDSLKRYTVYAFDFSFFFSERNKHLYYSTIPQIKKNSPYVEIFSKEYYLENYIETYEIPDIISKDTQTWKALYPLNHIHKRSSIYTSEKGFIPYLDDRRSIVFDEDNDQIIICEQPDSLMYIYNMSDSLIQKFGQKGKYIKLEDSIRYISSYNIVHDSTKDHKKYHVYTDSLRKITAYYYGLAANANFNYIARRYTVPDSVCISDKEVINHSSYIQIYNHFNLIADFNIPGGWVLAGFNGNDLVFYKQNRKQPEKVYFYVLSVM